MTSPKKPRSAATPKPAPAVLSADQLRVAQLFGAMDEEYQAALLPMIEAVAAAHPRRTRPVLRLVGGVQ